MLSPITIEIIFNGWRSPIFGFLQEGILQKKLSFGHFSARTGSCPNCGPTVFLRWRQSEMAVRCLRCRATPVTLSLVVALHVTLARLGIGLRHCHVLELSSRGALVRFLQRRAAKATLCEYFDDVPPGATKNGILCQDVQRLPFADASFDVCTCTEVFEHVPGDTAGFRELFQVLKPGGLLVFTVPLSAAAQTIERAALTANGVVLLLPPEYHGDRLRGANKVLCYRNYGQDILLRVGAAGFSHAGIHDGTKGNDVAWFGYGRSVMVAQKSA